jgi:hypothetical protein
MGTRGGKEMVAARGSKPGETTGAGRLATGGSKPGGISGAGRRGAGGEVLVVDEVGPNGGNCEAQFTKKIQVS